MCFILIMNVYFIFYVLFEHLYYEYMIQNHKIQENYNHTSLFFFKIKRVVFGPFPC